MKTNKNKRTVSKASRKVRVDKKLDKLSGKVLFKKKVERASKRLALTPLP